MDQHEQFVALLMRHQSDLRAFLAALVRDPHACDDLMQEVALVLWREFARYDASRSFGAWARGIAANKVMQRWDKLRRGPIPFSPEAIEAIVDACNRREQAAPPQADALRECLEELPDKTRRLLALRYETSLSVSQIAVSMESTLEAVHKALVRCRQRLRQCVERRLRGVQQGAS